MTAGSEYQVTGLSAFHLTGTDPDSSIDRQDKDLTIANPAGLCSTDDGCDQVVHLLVPHDDLDLDLGKHVHNHLLPPVLEGNSSLLSPSLDFCGSHGGNSFCLECFFYEVKPFRFDDRFYQFQR